MNTYLNVSPTTFVLILVSDIFIIYYYYYNVMIIARTTQARHAQNCRIHQVTASMTSIDLIINLGQDVLESVTALFKLAAPSLSSCALSKYFSQFYLCYCLVRIRCRY